MTAYGEEIQNTAFYFTACFPLLSKAPRFACSLLHKNPFSSHLPASTNGKNQGSPPPHQTRNRQVKKTDKETGKSREPKSDEATVFLIERTEAFILQTPSFQ
ncbi:Hypothetical predicted protein [Podarcis lilfordi]|uniref:Uncharacterized protein n=1 Tax=Podarcis lilfordi TaxID=74358 RepID=A0AA35JWY8_9SAUR|nr:Hypothetical predicted protein [Podarcis lilfordi]